MIPVVKRMSDQFFRKTLWVDKSPFLSDKDIVPSMQIKTPVESFSTIDIDIYTKDDVLVQTVTNNVTIEEYSELEQIVVHPQTELSTPLEASTLYYLKITAGSKEYYSQSFRTTTISRIVDVRVTQDDETRITQDSDRRTIHG